MTIKQFSQEQHANLFAQFFPDGKAYEAKFRLGSNLRLLIESLSIEQKRIYDLFSTFLEQRDPRTTDIFLDEWESSLGIPDSCIPIAATKQERRDNILLKLTSLSVQTEADFINLGAILGFTISFVNPPGFPYTFDFIFSDDENAFPYVFPFVFATETFDIVIKGDFLTNPSKADILQCLIRILIPAYKTVTFFNC